MSFVCVCALFDFIHSYRYFKLTIDVNYHENICLFFRIFSSGFSKKSTKITDASNTDESNKVSSNENQII